MLETIADEPGIALEYMVRIDDNPVECAEAARALPMVRTLLFPRQPEWFASLLADEGLFDALQFSKRTGTGRASISSVPQQRTCEAAPQISKIFTAVSIWRSSLNL